jgi:hypothetical protein
MRLALAALFAVLLAAPSHAQRCWGQASARTVVRTVEEKLLRWAPHGDGDQQDLMQGDKQIGAYRISTGVFRYVTRSGWSAPTTPPLAPPHRCQCKDFPDAGCCCGDKCACVPDAGVIEQVEQNFGLDLAGWSLDGREKASINGLEVTTQQAIHAAENGLPEDAHKLCLTITGTDEKLRKSVEDEVRAASYASECKIYNLPPDHWWLTDIDSKQRVFVAEHPVTITVQEAGGKVLWRQDGAADVVKNIEAARKQTKPYDPKKDPGPGSSAPVNVPDLIKQVPAWAWIAGGLMLVFLMRNGDKKP